MSRKALFPTKLVQGRNQHPVRCKTCKHKKRKEIENLFMEGKSPETIIILLNLKLDSGSIRGHVKAYGADLGRLYSALASCDMIISRYNQNFTSKPKLIPSDALYSKAIELKAKIAGELIEKHQHEHTGTVEVKVVVKRQIDNLKARISGKKSPDEDK